MLSAKKIRWALIVFFAMTVFTFSQNNNQENTLFQRAVSNQDLMNTDLEKAYRNIEEMLSEAVRTKDKNAELTLLANKCRYFLVKEDVGELIHIAEYFYSKAVLYKDIRMQAVAKKYIADAYRLNGLYDEAINELNLSLDILKRANQNDDNVKNTTANTYVGLANLYNREKHPETAVEKMKMAGRYFARLNNPEHKQFLFYVNNSDVAAMYVDINSDSAEYYVRKSIEYKPKNISRDDATMRRNNIILGIVNKNRGKYDEAIRFFKKAESMTNETGDRLNLSELYQYFIDTYKKTGNAETEKEYVSKLRELELELTRNKNESLHVIIEKEKEKQTQTDKAWRKKVIIGFLIIIPLFLLFLYFYKRNLHAKYERKSEEYLQDNTIPEEDKSGLYNEIIEMIKNNDPGLVLLFERAYPDFSHKLLAVNPNLSQSEIEFCMLLKLNLSSKEIARYRFIQVRTVQNKKYRIRKKLYITDSMDIYQWFNSL